MAAPMDPIATQTLQATWAGVIAALLAAISALWIAHQTNVRDDRRQQKAADEQLASFRKAIDIALRQVGSMSKPTPDPGNPALVRALFVRGLADAQTAIDYALRLNVADSELLQLALDAKAAFDLLAASYGAYGDDSFTGPGLETSRADAASVIALIKAKHPAA